MHTITHSDLFRADLAQAHADVVNFRRYRDVSYIVPIATMYRVAFFGVVYPALNRTLQYATYGMR